MTGKPAHLDGNPPTQQTLGATGTAWTYDGAGNRTGQQKYTNNQLQENINYTNRLLSKGSVDLYLRWHRQL